MLTASIIDGPSNGQLSEIDQSTGIVTYTPNLDFAGQDQFTYAVNDGTADSNAATVSIAVIAEEGEGTMVNPEPIPSSEPEPIPSQANDIQGIWDIDANNFKGILKIESVDNTGHFSGTVEFFGFPVDPIEGQYSSDSQVVTFTRPLPPNAFQSYTGQLDQATLYMSGSFTQSDTGGDYQWIATLQQTDVEQETPQGGDQSDESNGSNESLSDVGQESQQEAQDDDEEEEEN
jgi:hypothetical protein